MNMPLEKMLHSKDQSNANSFSDFQKTNSHSIGFVDNRPQALAQSKLQEVANNAPKTTKTMQLQVLTDKYSHSKQPIQKKENNTGLPDNLKSGIENLSGYSMDDVKVNYNSDKPAQLNAHAYAQGTDIHIASGQEKHLPHEAWHVVQQKQGRVQPTMQMKGLVNINDDEGLEKEADLMGAKSLSLNIKEVPYHKTNLMQGVSQLVVQRIEYSEAVIGKNYQYSGKSYELIKKVNGWLKLKNLGKAVRASEVDEISEVEEEPMDAHSRLVRANDRASERGLSALGTRVEAPTPFGMTGLSRNRYSATEPQSTSRASDFDGASNPGAAYSDWTGKVPDWTEFANSMDEGPTGKAPANFTKEQNRASAMIYGTTHYSEPYRMPAADKVARSAVRAKAAGSNHVFSHLFPMAQVGGAHAYAPYLKDGTGLTPSQEAVLEDMSSSSDDEA